MDRDDPNYPQDQNPEDDSAFEEAPPAEGEASPEGENWQEPPPEDFADPEQAYAEEQAETNEGGALPRYAEENPEESLEDDYVSPSDEEAATGEEDLSTARSQAEQYLPPGIAGMAPPWMKYLPYIGAGVLLLILGFFGIQQIQGMMALTAPKNNDASAAALAPPPNFPAKGAGQKQAQEDTDSHAPAPLPPPSIASQQKILSPADVPVSPTAGETRSTDTARGPDYVLPSSGASTTTPEAVAAASPASPASQNNGTPLPASSPPASSGSALEEQLTALSRQLEEVKKNQERLDEQLRTMQANASSVPSEEVKTGMHSLEEKISQLEQRFTAPTEQKAEKAASEDKPAPHRARKSKSKRSKDFMAAHPQDPRYGVGGLPNTQAPIPPQTYATGPYQPSWAPQPMPVPVSRPAGWLLRSAQPGAAWLSQGMSTDLHRVVPGDKIEGLGTIVSIRMVGGRWLVEGTQGSVR